VNSLSGKGKSVAVSMEYATVLVYEKAFHLIRLYTEQVWLLELCNCVFIMVLSFLEGGPIMC